MGLNDLAESRWALMPIEIKVRELESRVLLACHFAEAGYNVVLGQQTPLMRSLHRLPQGVYFDKDVSVGKPPRIAKRAKLGLLNVSSDEEGLSADYNPEYYVRDRVSSQAIAKSAMVFCWGEYEASLIKSKFPEVADKLRVTGNPRLDLWRNVSASLFEEEAKRISRKYGRYVLIPSHFGEMGMRPESRVAKEFVELKAHYHPDDPVMIQYYADMVTEQARRFELSSKAITAMARALPDVNFVLRPHPTDVQPMWHDMFKDCPNVCVEYEGAIAPWILASDLVIHAGCTTGIEAYLMGKPVLTYLKDYNTEFDDWLANSVSRQIDAQDDLIKVVEQHWSGREPVTAVASEAVKHVLCLRDDASSCDLIVRAVDDLELPKQKLTYRPRLFRKAWRDALRGNPTINKTRERIGEFNQHQKNRTYSRQKFTVLHLQELQDLIARFTHTVGRFQNIKAYPLDHNLYVLTSQC